MPSDKRQRLAMLETRLAPARITRMIRFIVEPSPDGARTVSARGTDGRVIERRQRETDDAFQARALRELEAQVE